MATAQCSAIRDAAKKKIIYIAKLVNEIDDTEDLARIRLKLTKLEEQWITFEEAHNKMIDASGPSEIPFQDIEFQTLEPI